jgi:hypothetical protein
MGTTVIRNPKPPVDLGNNILACPECGNILPASYAAYDANNRAHRKMACSTCGYVAWREYGYGSMKDADTTSFK